MTFNPAVLRALLFSVAIVGAGTAAAEVTLPALIGDGMVLQRDARIRVWGWADPGEHVRISLQHQHVTARTDSHGRWSTSLKPIPAGGPYEMQVRGTNSITIHDVLIGDVWLASGQSNMSFAMYKPEDREPQIVEHALEELDEAHYPAVRLFSVPETAAAQPLQNVQSNSQKARQESKWQPVTRDSVSSFSAVAYFFARDLHRRYGVPIGMIKSTVGGTTAEAWTSRPALANFPEFNRALESLDNNSATRETPTTLFNGMINPLISYRIKGVIWYQGESNTGGKRALQYQRLFPALIADWRKHWGYDFPFLFVQLAGFGPNKVEPANYPWAELREAQSLALSVPKTAMATAIDLGSETDLHPPNKQRVAERLVLAARKVVYGEDVVCCGPAYESMQPEGNRIRIKYKDVGSGLSTHDEQGQIKGFEIAAADGKFAWAEARQEGNDIVVFNPGIQQPVAVRYAWRNTPDGNLYNKEDLPALPFRATLSNATLARESLPGR